MAGTVLLVQPESEREGSVPSGVALASNDMLEEVARPEEALGRLAQAEHGIDALVLPPDIDEPLEIAQRAHALDPDLAVVMVCPPERCVEIQRALEFAPFLGEDVIVLSSAEENALPTEVAKATRRTRRRRDQLGSGEPSARKLPPAQQYLGQLLGHAPFGVAVVDPAGALIGWNTRAGEIFGAAERDLVGTSLADLFEDPSAVTELIGRATVDASPPTVVFERLSAAGKAQFVEVTAAGLTGRAGEPGVMVVLRDVTERMTGADERRWMEEALRFQKTLLESQSEASMEGTLVVSREGRILSFNRRFGELWGLPPDGVDLRSGDAARIALEQTLTRPDDFLERFVALAADANETGREKLMLRDGRLFETYSAPVKSPEGAHYGRVWFFRDLTDTKLAEERLRYLAEATEILGSSLDYEETLRTVARLAIPTLADWCIVDELREDGAIARVAVSAASEGKQVLVEELRDRYPPTWDSPQPAARALREGEMVVFGELSPDALRKLVFDERHFELMCELDPRSALALPLIAHGQTLGVITFAFSESGRHYGPSDISLATEIARRAALAVDRARLYRGEHAARLAAEAAHDRLAFLAEASEALARSLDYEATLARVATLAVPRLADWCIVYLAEPGGRIRRLAVEHAGDLWARALVAELADFEFDPDAGHGVPSVIRSGQPEFHRDATAALFASDAVERERLEELLADVGIASWMCVPLGSHERTLGAITFVSNHPERRYTEDDLALAQELASRAALAVDNARLYGEAQDAFRSKETTFALLNTLLRTAPVGLAFFDSNLRYVLLNDALAEMNGAPAIAHIGKSVSDVVPDIDPQMATDMERVLETGQPITDRQVDVPTAEGEPARHWVSSYYPVELAGGAAGIGAVVVDISERQRGEEERAKLLDLERQARDAAERAHQVIRHVEFVSEAALSHLDFENVLRELLSRVATVLDADTAVVLLVDEETNELIAHTAKGLEREVEVGVRIPIGKGFAGRIAAERRPLMIEHVTETDVVNPILLEEGVQSLLGVPLIVEGRVTGVIHVGTFQPRAFSEDDARVLQVVGDRVALALEQSRLYEAERSARAQAEAAQSRLGFLAEASAVLASSLDYESTLALVAELAVAHLAEWCALYLVDEGQTLRQFAVAHADPEKQGLVHELEERYPFESERANLISEAIETGEPILVSEIPRELIAESAIDEDHRRLLEALGFSSVMVVPLVAHGRSLGAIAFAGSEHARPFTETDLEHAQELGRRAAVAVDNARLFREAEERGNAARALETIADGVFLVDSAGIVRLWNPGAEAITGLSADEIVGRPAAEAISGWEDVAHMLPVADAPGPQRTRPETVPIEVGGREIWLSVSAVGFSEGTVYAFRDLTEERRLDQLKTEFVATASHELRTPLAAVYGAAMTLRRGELALDEDRRDLLLAVIADQSDRLARIVNDILWASRLDSGELGIEIKPFDVRASAHRVIEAARTHLPPGVELELIASPDLPPVAADESKVQQVLTNLLENAIKYSPDGGRIQVRLEAGERRLRLSVTDKGIGIPTNEHSRIFEKFYRLDPNLTRGVGGTGLGLYICRELVRRMNGRIWLDSREGDGSTFWVELPLADS